MAPCFGQETHKASYSTFYLYNHYIYLCGIQTKTHCATVPPGELLLVSELYQVIERKSKNDTHFLSYSHLLSFHHTPYILHVTTICERDIFRCVPRGSITMFMPERNNAMNECYWMLTDVFLYNPCSISVSCVSLHPCCCR